MDKFWKGVLNAFGIALVFVFMTPLCVLLGWLTGVFLQWLCGNVIASGMNLLFGTTRFTPQVIPYITATLSVLVGYFTTKTTVSNS